MSGVETVVPVLDCSACAGQGGDSSACAGQGGDYSACAGQEWRLQSLCWSGVETAVPVLVRVETAVPVLVRSGDSACAEISLV